MALLVLSIVLSIFSVVISLNVSSKDLGNSPQSVNHIIRIQQPGAGKVQLYVEPNNDSGVPANG